MLNGINTDIRRVEGDFSTLVNEVQSYCDSGDFCLTQCKIEETQAEIISENLSRSAFHLYCLNAPQKLFWSLVQLPNGRVEIKLRSELFQSFRIFYYSILFALLSALVIFFNHKKFSSFLPFDTNFHTLIAIGFVLVAYLFFLRSISSKAYSNFANEFYDRLSTTKPIVIQNRLNFPDIVPVAFLFLLFAIITILLSDKRGPAVGSPQYFWILICAAILIISILLLLVLLMLSNRAVETRAIFILMGMGFCISMAIYSNLPFELASVGSIQSEFEARLETKIFKTDASFSQDFQTLIENRRINSFLKKVSSFYLLAAFIALSISCVLLVVLLRVPAYVGKSMESFLYFQKDSSYFKALQPESIPFFFNILIFSLWVISGVASLTGGYFAISIVENTFFKSNIVFSSEFAQNFFSNTNLCLLILMHYYLNDSVINLFHKVLMLLYSVPILTLFLSIMIKYILSIKEDWALITKKTSGKLERYECVLQERLHEICQAANVLPPVIEIKDSTDVDVKTRFVGFPFFKNVFIISNGVYSELSESPYGLDALLAHEVWHIKKHNIARRFLCSLSDYTLFGNGFLAVLQNSFQVEKEADEFAIRWIMSRGVEKGKAISTFQTLLERLEELSLRNQILKGSVNLSFLRIATYRKKYLKNYGELTFWGRVNANLRTLFHIYFGTEILSYFHPPTSLRIAWLKEAFQDET